MKNAALDGLRRVERAGGHDGAVLRESIPQLAAAAQVKLEVAKWDLKLPNSSTVT